MATIAPPTIVIDQPSNAPTAPPAQRVDPPISNGSTTTTTSKSKAQPPSIDTTPVPSPTSTPTRTRSASIFNRPNSASSVPSGSEACYLCDEQNPGDFSPTTKYLETCLLCNRWFCPIHKSVTLSGCCDINHSTYFHKMLGEAHRLLNTNTQSSERERSASISHTTTTTSTNGESRHKVISPNAVKKVLEGRDLAEVLIQEGIYPSLGEREKAIFTTSPVDERKQRELESFRSLDAAVANGGERRKRISVQEMDLVGADVAV